MKGALTVDEPRGQRWGLALDLLSNSPDVVALGPGLLLFRDTAGPASDGHIHIEVLSASSSPSRGVAQAQVDQLRTSVAQIAAEDPRFASLIDRCGVVWEYVEDLDTTRVRLAEIGPDGVLLWPDH
ncbi:MAG: hypothetical protein ACLP62_08430 [Acidimicrobiales bacterium]